MSTRAIDIAAGADEYHLRTLTDDALDAEALARMAAFENTFGVPRPWERLTLAHYLDDATLRRALEERWRRDAEGER